MKRIKLKALYSKGALIAFALLFSFLVTIGSTFSWVTSSDQKVNEFRGEMGLKAIIVEDFTQRSKWKPGESVAKTVSVCNDGISPSFVRISFEEIMKRMEPSSVPEPFGDPEEAGVTPEYCIGAEWNGSGWEAAGTVFGTVEFREKGTLTPAPADVVVKVKESPAGAQRNRYAIYQTVDGACRRMTALFSVSGTTLTVGNPRYWGYKDAYVAKLEAAWGLAHETSPGTPVTPPAAADIETLICDAGKKISIEYTNVVTALGSVGADNGKWFYNEHDEFFYYIGRLEPGASSVTLMTGLRLAPDADVSYSSLNLQFIVNLQALQAKAGALADWGLTSGQLYDRLSSFC